MEGARLGMGRGGHQLGRRCGAFLAGAFSFLKKHVPFQQTRVLTVFGVPSRKKVIKYAQATAGEVKTMLQMVERVSLEC